MSNPIAIRDQFQPAMSLQEAAERFNAVNAFASSVLRKGIDFDVIPGTTGKPTLLKPGAEKLTTFFGLSVRFIVVKEIEDWDGSQHGDEPLFYYAYRCQLWRGDLLVAESDASANSRESKYRWRASERLCPECGKPTIIKGKEEYGGGFVCFAKKGGCGAKFKANEPAILEQVVGRVANPDIFDQINTLQKMSQKRALIAATLLAVNASEFFTQDIEDIELPHLHEASAPTQPPPAPVRPAPQRPAPPAMRTIEAPQRDDGELFPPEPPAWPESGGGNEAQVRRLAILRDGARSVGITLEELTPRLARAMTPSALDLKIGATHQAIKDRMSELWAELPSVLPEEITLDLDSLSDTELIELAQNIQRRVHAYIAQGAPVAA